eukprot:gene88-biopygen28
MWIRRTRGDAVQRAQPVVFHRLKPRNCWPLASDRALREPAQRGDGRDKAHAAAGARRAQPALPRGERLQDHHSDAGGARLRGPGPAAAEPLREAAHRRGGSARPAPTGCTGCGGGSRYGCVRARGSTTGITGTAA